MSRHILHPNVRSESRRSRSRANYDFVCGDRLVRQTIQICQGRRDRSVRLRSSRRILRSRTSEGSSVHEGGIVTGGREESLRAIWVAPLAPIGTRVEPAVLIATMACHSASSRSAPDRARPYCRSTASHRYADRRTACHRTSPTRRHLSRCSEARTAWHRKATRSSSADQSGSLDSFCRTDRYCCVVSRRRACISSPAPRS